jgi:hypothetical protein
MDIGGKVLEVGENLLRFDIDSRKHRISHGRGDIVS